ncbi:MAG: AAA family ATPase [Deltaproteobacteria bacterium]|nr:AAA family ATPase [Candidatus Zymogenaceae bacterium]
MFLLDMVVSGVGKYAKAVKFTFHKGYNVILGGNESGKSSIARALMAVLFPDVYSGDKDFLNWQLEGASRCYATIQQGNEAYRLVRDYTQGLSNLSRYIKEQKTFVLVTKDHNEINDFITGTLNIPDEEIYSHIFFSDLNGLPSTNPFGAQGLAPKAAPAKKGEGEVIDEELDEMDIADVRERLDTLRQEMVRAQEIEKLQMSMDDEQAKVYELQTKVQKVTGMEEELEGLNDFIAKFESMGDMEGVMARIQKFSDTERRKEVSLAEVKNRRGQANAELTTAPVPNIKDNKFITPGLSIAGGGILVAFILWNMFLGSVLVNDLGLAVETAEKIRHAVQFAIVIGLGVAGWGAWQIISARGNIGRLNRMIVDADEQIAQINSRFAAEEREIKALMTTLGADNMVSIKEKVKSFEQAKRKRQKLATDIEAVKQDEEYQSLMRQQDEIDVNIARIQKQLEGAGALGFTPQEMKSEVNRLEKYLKKRGVIVSATGEGGGKKGPFGAGRVESRFPTDHVARFLAIATELVQKGKMDPLSELQKIFNENIKLLTNNGYARATFSQGGVIKFFKADSLLRVSMDSMSPATKDSMYFALKFAMIESMLSHMALPVVLDDPFVMFDDERLAAAVAIIKRISQKTQVVLLTSRQGALKGADRSLKIK